MIKKTWADGEKKKYDTREVELLPCQMWSMYR